MIQYIRYIRIITSKIEEIDIVKKEQSVREAATIYLRPLKLTFDLLTLKLVPESRMTWATSVPILVFLGLSVLDLGPNVRDRYTSDTHHCLMPLP